ncbi:MAG: molybdopterin-dependent oxidoreductase [Planctomycetota bacterium]
MPQITIDGKVCEFEGNKMILEVALENEVAIPHYCYHPGLSVVASCRICLAEVSAPNPRNDNKVELIPKLMPTCQTPAADGQVVHLSSPNTVRSQKSVMELLLINHPLDCPVCDQAGECYLQDYSFKYGRGTSRFEEAKIKQPKKDVGDHVLLYSDRCIMCSHCVRFTREVTGTNELGIFGRGAREQIDVFPGRPLNNELSGNVIDICPVGALLDKDFLMSMRVWNLTKTATIDGITASGDNISLETNEGRVYRCKPRTNMDVNQWWTSDEIRFGWKFIHSPDRLRSPLRRTGDEVDAYRECDWNEAYRFASGTLRDIVRSGGGGSLVAMISPMLPSEEAYALGKLAIGVDHEAHVGLGPVPIQGEDKTFPGGYTVRAEKCPNRRGVQRALGQLTAQVRTYDELLAALKSPDTKAALLTGNYPSDWATDELIAALDGKFVVAIDTLPSRVTQKADVVLPGATWAEKTGVFENAEGRLQSFTPAIPVIELAKPEGQIACDLAAACGLASPSIFDAPALRTEMGDAFVTDVHHPESTSKAASDLEYVEL